MQLLDDATVLSATDLNNFLACEHLTALDLAVLHDGLTRPAARPGQATLLAQLGEAHERTYLEKLRRRRPRRRHDRAQPRPRGGRRGDRDTRCGPARRSSTRRRSSTAPGSATPTSCAASTSALEGGRWDWHYEVEDTKLARHTEPYFLLQLCYYSEHVARVQGARGALDARRARQRRRGTSFRVDDFAAYYRDVKARFLQRLDDDAPTYPLPVGHCGLCVWDAECCERRKRGRSPQRRRAASRACRPAGSTRPGSRRCAALGRRARYRAPAREDGRADVREAAPPSAAAGRAAPRARRARSEPVPLRVHRGRGRRTHRGFCLLPEPSPGDVFFDMEGDPYYDIGTGLEYLFGAYTRRRRDVHAVLGLRPFRAARQRPAGREEGVRSVHRLRDGAPRAVPGDARLSLRVVREDGAAEAEPAARDARGRGRHHPARRGAGRSLPRRAPGAGRRAAELLDQEDRGVLRQARRRVGRQGRRRVDPAVRGSGSRRAATRRSATTRMLDDLETYNEYDCVSTHGLREWLLELRAKAAAQFGVRDPAVRRQAGRRTQDPRNQVRRPRSAASKRGSPRTSSSTIADPRHDAVRPFFLARHMLEYHWREDKPVWWRFHDRCSTYHEDPDQLRDDSETHRRARADRRAAAAEAIDRVRVPLSAAAAQDRHGQMLRPRDERLGRRDHRDRGRRRVRAARPQARAEPQGQAAATGDHGAQHRPAELGARRDRAIRRGAARRRRRPAGTAPRSTC